MILAKKLTKRCYVISNVVLAAMLTNVVFLAPALKMGEAFTAGLATGMAVGWAIFAVSGYLALRKPGAFFDERFAAIQAVASRIAFWVLVLALSVLAALLRSETLAFEPRPADLAAVLSNLGLATYLVAAFIASRTM